MKYSNPNREGAPFIAISRSKLEGLWYCDKWAWNNVIYQPGAYGTQINDNAAQYTYFTGDFLLTSSAATNNSVTVNRSWSGGTPAADATVNLYRYYTIGGVCDGYKLIESKSLSASASSISFTGLYGGNYAITQTLPNNYSDDSANTFTYISGTGKPAVLSSGTAASVAFTNTYTEPTKYAVNISPITGGSMTPDKTQAIAGETVNLTITPADNMQLKSGTLKYNDGTNDYFFSGTSFIMPASAVTVSAEFEAKQYAVSIGTLTGGSIVPDKTQAAAGDTVNLTVTPEDGKQLKSNSLIASYGTTTMPITGTSFIMPNADVTITGTFETPFIISTDTLPEGMQGVPYSATILAQGGTSDYSWSAEGLPDGITLDASTGILNGTAAEYGSFDVDITVTDGNGDIANKALTLYLNAMCGNGAYLLTPKTSANYEWTYADGGLPAMTVKNGISGFKTFSVSILPQTGHNGSEALLFVHIRNGEQIGISANFADYDTIPTAMAAFNVKPDDVIKVYIVDDISSDAGQNPNIL